MKAGVARVQWVALESLALCLFTNQLGRFSVFSQSVFQYRCILAEHQSSFYHFPPVHSAPATLASLLPCATHPCFLCVGGCSSPRAHPLTPPELCLNSTFSEKPFLTTTPAPIPPLLVLFSRVLSTVWYALYFTCLFFMVYLLHKREGVLLYSAFSRCSLKLLSE